MVIIRQKWDRLTEIMRLTLLVYPSINHQYKLGISKTGGVCARNQNCNNDLSHKQIHLLPDWDYLGQFRINLQILEDAQAG